MKNTIQYLYLQFIFAITIMAFSHCANLYSTYTVMNFITKHHAPFHIDQVSITVLNMDNSFKLLKCK